MMMMSSDDPGGSSTGLLLQDSLVDHIGSSEAALPDTKEGIEELCPVCGDVVSGYHYGLLTCESCKGFFKRTVQNKKVYQCVGDKTCHIDKSQRKRCPFCRFQKCLDVGMKLEAVRADRMRGGRNKFGPMYKRDRARKLQMMRQKQVARSHCQGSGTENLDFLFAGPPGPSSLYPPADPAAPLKQELIQIPQLSSSSSEPSGFSPGWQVPTLLREFHKSTTDEWQSQLFALLHSQPFGVDHFEMLCRVLNQALFCQVDWARNSIFFKDFKVDDQMKLLQNAWSDLLILEHLHQRLHNNLPDEWALPCGQKLSLHGLSLLGLMPNLMEGQHRLMARLTGLKLDVVEYVALKFVVLLNPDAYGLSNAKLVHDVQDQTKQALLEYTVNAYPRMTDKYDQLMHVLQELKTYSNMAEDFLWYRLDSSIAPTQTLLIEMLHAKKK